jgi:hypothetical protein
VRDVRLCGTRLNDIGLTSLCAANTLLSAGSGSEYWVGSRCDRCMMCMLESNSLNGTLTTYTFLSPPPVLIKVPFPRKLPTEQNVLVSRGSARYLLSMMSYSTEKALCPESNWASFHSAVTN